MLLYVPYREKEEAKQQEPSGVSAITWTIPSFGTRTDFRALKRWMSPVMKKLTDAAEENTKPDNPCKKCGSRYTNEQEICSYNFVYFHPKSSDQKGILYHWLEKYENILTRLRVEFDVLRARPVILDDASKKSRVDQGDHFMWILILDRYDIKLSSAMRSHEDSIKAIQWYHGNSMSSYEYAQRLTRMASVNNQCIELSGQLSRSIIHFEDEVWFGYEQLGYKQIQREDEENKESIANFKPRLEKMREEIDWQTNLPCAVSDIIFEYIVSDLLPLRSEGGMINSKKRKREDLVVDAMIIE